MKDKIECENCGKVFIMDEVDYIFAKENKKPLLCEVCELKEHILGLVNYRFKKRV